MSIVDATKSTPARTWIPRRLLSGQSLRRAAALVAPILAGLADESGLVAVESWSLLAASWTITGTATMLVGPRGCGPLGVLRMSTTGWNRLQHESEVLSALRREPALADFRPLVPRRHAEGVAGDWRYVLDEYIEGVDASVAVAADPGLLPAAQRAGVCSVTVLHRSTAAPVVIDEELLQRWVDEPIEALARSLKNFPMRLQKRRLVGLRERLHAGLLGREVQAGWIHGDFWLGNIRVAPDTGRATGIIDWDCAGSPELPAHDLVHLALYGQSLERGVSLGSMVAEVVEKGTWPAECEELIRHSRWSWGDRISDSDVALLYWLRYVSAMIDQQRDYVHHSVLVWQYRNVLRVLRAL